MTMGSILDGSDCGGNVLGLSIDTSLLTRPPRSLTAPSSSKLSPSMLMRTTDPPVRPPLPSPPPSPTHHPQPKPTRALSPLGIANLDKPSIAEQVHVVELLQSALYTQYPHLVPAPASGDVRLGALADAALHEHRAHAAAHARAAHATAHAARQWDRAADAYEPVRAPDGESWVWRASAPPDAAREPRRASWVEEADAAAWAAEREREDAFAARCEVADVPRPPKRPSALCATPEDLAYYEAGLHASDPPILRLSRTIAPGEPGCVRGPTVRAPLHALYPVHADVFAALVTAPGASASRTMNVFAPRDAFVQYVGLCRVRAVPHAGGLWDVLRRAEFGADALAAYMRAVGAWREAMWLQGRAREIEGEGAGGPLGVVPLVLVEPLGKDLKVVQALRLRWREKPSCAA
ncbi:hypothetical protein FA95DRAFT_1605138 [Auriscalpium vulgare]|uniref:Uncharacterized protein n=1 Tax=Auriscalpium vulgare TaxID=40419 RepID=A0ACB8RX10_9AGAM|nr:hypothetical protein FA95DRAFT_1605138 [Auriscalpium vulgare]